ncbi:unnamed protein product [Mycena citricolor]|nr:unnamed protein product [Mycena citricolor]
MAEQRRQLGMGLPPGPLHQPSSRSFTSPELAPPSRTVHVRGPQSYMPYDYHSALLPNPSYRIEGRHGTESHLHSLEARFAQMELRQQQSDDEIVRLRDRNLVLEAQLVAVSAAPNVPAESEVEYEDTGNDADTEELTEDIFRPASTTSANASSLHHITAGTTSATPSPRSQSSALASAVPRATKPVALPSLGLPFASLTPDQQKVRRQLTAMVNATFRSICAVAAKKPWPDPSIERTDPVTKEHIFTPNFPGGLGDPYNIKMFDTVAMSVLKQIQDPDRCPTGLDTCGATVDFKVLRNFTKEAFKGFNKHYKAQIDEEAQERLELSQAKDRETQRRRLKLKHRLGAVDEYAAAHNLDCNDVAGTLDLEHMSDEYSGPELPDKDRATWALNMAHASGRHNPTPLSIADLTFIEVCEFDWRTEKATNLMLELSQIHENSLSNTQRDRRRLIRVRTRRSSRRFPAKAPFNFAVRSDWLAEKKQDETMAEILGSAGWGDFPGPKGFDSDDGGADQGFATN